MDNKKLTTPHHVTKISIQKIKEDDERLHKFGITSKSTKEEQKRALTWALLASYLPEDVKSIEKDFVRHAEYTLALTRNNINNLSAFKATSLSVRDRLIERWKDTQDYFFEKDCKRVAYLSLEFLLGRSLQNSIYNLTLEENYKKALLNLGYKLEELCDEESDAGLGNGGLGRLAACFLDSLATCDYPGWGYGLRYTYGMFHQKIIDGKQIEFPDYWLLHGNPWEVERLDVQYTVRFYGKTIEVDGKEVWVDTDDVIAVAYDTPIPGYKTFNTLNIRLWNAQPVNLFDLKYFNTGDFYKSIEERQKAEQITQVLYPNDKSHSGKELRLKQQYFFVSATLQDLIRRFKRKEKNFEKFPEKVAVQLNDTHPTLAIVELMRYMLDEEEYEWEKAWDLVTKTFAYTNHTVLPEALEKWPVPLMSNLLPRHMRIIYDINHHWMKTVGEAWPNDIKKLQIMSIIDEDYPKYVRMSHLAIVGSHHVNGVAKIHSEILKTSVFPDFVTIFPNKFSNKTNGVTPRRWVQQANPPLAKLISEKLGGNSWLVDWNKLKELRKFAKDKNFIKTWQEVHELAKKRLVKEIEKKCDISIPLHFLFDVQIKRIHEYKRQLLNILYVIHKYNEFKKMSPEEKKKFVPRAIIFGGKAAPGYDMAKLIIYLVNCVANVVNNDEDAQEYLKVVFIPNYCVSLAEVIIPGCDLSQHISTAGMEASGTSNMKFAMNGVLILGTMDGANVEIAEEIGEENMFIFGARAEKVPELRHLMRMNKIELDPRFTAVLKSLKRGDFGESQQWRPIFESLEHGNDYYLLGVDFTSYLETQEKIDQVFMDKEKWTEMSILSVAGSGKFSSDRTISEYAKEVWGIDHVRRPGAKPVILNKLTPGGIDDFGISPSFREDSVLLESHVPLVERMYPNEDEHDHKKDDHKKDDHPKFSNEPKDIIEGFNVSNDK